MIRNIDWDAMMSAFVEAMLLVAGLYLATAVLLVILFVSLALSGFIYWGFTALLLVVLTCLFYKYEKSVNEEDTP